MVGSPASAILGPTLFTNQRHERDGAEILFSEVGFALACKLDQGLIAIFLTDGNDQAAADCELLLKGRGYFRPARRDEDRIKGRGFGPPSRAIADTQLDIVVTELLEPLPSGIAQ